MIGVELSPAHAKTVARLQELRDELQKKAVGSGLTAAAKPLKAAMAALAPSQTGKLKRSIGQVRLSKGAGQRLGLIGTSKVEDAGIVAILVGPVRRVDKSVRAGRLANILEEGAKPHRIRPKTARGLLKLRGGLFARSVMHPGIRATHFMQRALQQVEPQIEDLFFKGVEARIGKLL